MNTPDDGRNSEPRYDAPLFDFVEPHFDAICDYAKYAEARSCDLSVAVANRLMELAARGQIDMADAKQMREMLVEGRQVVWTATQGIIGGTDEDCYHDGRPVRSALWLDTIPTEDLERLAPLSDFPSGDVEYFSYTWHPDPTHPRNQPRELQGSEVSENLYGATEDGWTAKVIAGCVRTVVSGPGHLDSLTHDGPRGWGGWEELLKTHSPEGRRDG